MKLCKDCKFFQEASNKEAFCLHADSVKYDDPVYGEHSGTTCKEMRLGNEQQKGKCGIFGKLWVAKPGFMPAEYGKV